jgi:YD repeat-containing protein
MKFVNTPGSSQALAPQGVVLIDPATGLPITADQPLAVALVSNNVTLTGPVTVSNAVEITNDAGNAIPVSGPVTDAQLRAAAVPVTGPLTDAQLRAAAVPVSGPLTDTQLRASPLKVSLATDSTGATINPDGWSHVFAYNGSGQLVTDTATDGATSWVKTFTYTSGNLTGETKWVRQ